jgi:hypothetical protein
VGITFVESGRKGLALIDVLLQLGQAGFEEFLFLSRERSDGVNLLNPVELKENGI